MPLLAIKRRQAGDLRCASLCMAAKTLPLSTLWGSPRIQTAKSHLTQAGLPFYTPEAFTKGMDDGGKLDWRLAFDGMTIDLPVGSDEVRFGKY